jgi:hypothetical protein
LFARKAALQCASCLSSTSGTWCRPESFPNYFAREKPLTRFGFFTSAWQMLNVLAGLPLTPNCHAAV